MIQVQNLSRMCGGFRICRQNPKSGQRSENGNTNAIIAALSLQKCNQNVKINAITAAHHCKIATKMTDKRNNCSTSLQNYYQSDEIKISK